MEEIKIGSDSRFEHKHSHFDGEGFSTYYFWYYSTTEKTNKIMIELLRKSQKSYLAISNIWIEGTGGWREVLRKEFSAQSALTEIIKDILGLTKEYMEL